MIDYSRAFSSMNQKNTGSDNAGTAGLPVTDVDRDQAVLLS